jgi:hypothetical protein
MSAATASAVSNAPRSKSLISSVCTHCLYFAVFVAVCCTIPILTMVAIVGNADGAALMWLAELWAMLTVSAIAGGAALYAGLAFASDWYRQRRTHVAIATAFDGMKIEDPDATLVTTGRRGTEKMPAPSNVVHADFGKHLRHGFRLLSPERNKIAS